MKTNALPTASLLNDIDYRQQLITRDFYVDTTSRDYVEALLLNANFGNFLLSNSENNPNTLRMSVRVKPSDADHRHFWHFNITPLFNEIQLNSDLLRNSVAYEQVEEDLKFQNWKEFQDYIQQKIPDHILRPQAHKELCLGWQIEDLFQIAFNAPFIEEHKQFSAGDAQEELLGKQPGSCIIRPSGTYDGIMALSYVTDQNQISHVRFALAPTKGYVIRYYPGQHAWPYIGEPPQSLRPMAQLKGLVENCDLEASYQKQFSDCITLEVFVTPVKLQGCQHVFDQDQINQWLAQNQSCPCCRQSEDLTLITPTHDSQLAMLQAECHKWRLAHLDEQALRTNPDFSGVYMQFTDYIKHIENTRTMVPLQYLNASPEFNFNRFYDF